MSVIDAGSGDPSIGLEREREVIAAMRGIGMRLANLTDGGEGAPGRVLSSEARSKISAAHRGRKHSPEHVANQAAALRGRKHSSERRDALIASIRAKGSRIGKNRRMSDQEIADIRATYSGREGEVAAIARATGWSTPTILRALDATLWVIPDEIIGCPIAIDIHDRSARRGASERTIDRVRTIRDRYAAGHDLRDVAEDLGLSLAHVRQIAYRAKFKDVA